MTTANGVSLDFMEKKGEISSRHFAFLVSEAKFDLIFSRVRERGLPFWADPACKQPGETPKPRKVLVIDGEMPAELLQ